MTFEHTCRKLIEIQRLMSAVYDDQELTSSVENAASVIEQSFNKGGKLLLCGNGGSASQAEHLAGEFVGKFYLDRPALPALSFTCPSASVTATANDYGYDKIFRRQVDAFVEEGDVLWGLTTSGNSKNLYQAFDLAKEYDGVTTILMTGENETDLCKLSDIVISVPSTDTPRIQEVHIMLGHIIAEIVEKARFG